MVYLRKTSTSDDELIGAISEQALEVYWKVWHCDPERLDTQPNLLAGADAVLAVFYRDDREFDKPALRLDLVEGTRFTTHALRDMAAPETTLYVGTSDREIAKSVALWLESLPTSPDHVPILSRAIDAAILQILQFEDLIDRLSKDNAELQAALDTVTAERDELDLIRQALLNELRRAGGPSRATSRWLARAGALLVATIAGAAGGAAQQVVLWQTTPAPAHVDAPAPRSEDTLDAAISAAVRSAIEACRVIERGDEIE